MSQINLLAPAIQKVAYDSGIRALRPLQEDAIDCILGSRNDLLLSAGTASGKTEACFLPVLSLLENSLKDNFEVLYIAPLNALINDQNKRLNRLCTPLRVHVQRWHGDVSASEKKKFMSNPTGILQITPESLESIFVNKTASLAVLFEKLKFIVIDEIHTFIDSRRGLQLLSLIHRLKAYTACSVRTIGLSATIADPIPFKNWINPKNPENVQLIESARNNKEARYALFYFMNEEHLEIPVELLKDITYLCRDKRNLIFCNQRALAETLAVKLNRIAERNQAVKQHFFVHHSSINKEQKEFIEKRLAEPTEFNSTLCTSTLELGIDLGELDYILQIDDTPSVSSFKQRLGRSGRKEGAPQVMQMYATHEESLLYALAIMEASKMNQLETPEISATPFDILFHQLLSLSVEKSTLSLHNLFETIRDNPIFTGILQEDLLVLLEDMFAKDYLKLMPTGAVILGLGGEKILRNYQFYSVFFSPTQYDVVDASNNFRVGTLTKANYLLEDTCFILSGRLWRITKIDERTKKLYVIAAQKGKALFLGNGYDRNDLISTKAFEILLAHDDYSYLNDEGRAMLADMRKTYHLHPCTIHERLIFPLAGGCVIDTFIGDLIVRTLCKMLSAAGYPVRQIDPLGRIYIERPIEPADLKGLIKNSYPDLLSPEEIENTPLEKYGAYLPFELKKKMLYQEYLNIDKAKSFLAATDFIQLSR